MKCTCNEDSLHNGGFKTLSNESTMSEDPSGKFGIISFAIEIVEVIGILTYTGLYRKRTNENIRVN